MDSPTWLSLLRSTLMPQTTPLGVLVQEDHPLAFENRKLSEIERWYTVEEKELLAVVVATAKEQFRVRRPSGTSPRYSIITEVHRASWQNAICTDSAYRAAGRGAITGVGHWPLIFVGEQKNSWPCFRNRRIVF
ncbi:hypothetical protein NE237_019254 [Protea cynaroides]|uniref:Reverse transcriptase RNase H-like domain-containing protein n=1 Tax=Protea cynaroides TaxID=273540 RepID=A0A9Q0QPP7_9MAGN|nr:hypothetical protein NE237_019254 [Protea cynaroides]